MLERRAGKLFEHVSGALGGGLLGGPLGADYLAALRHLLAQPAYCSKSSSAVFQGGQTGGWAGLWIGCHRSALCAPSTSPLLTPVPIF
jgi:hypothetical protein